MKRYTNILLLLISTIGFSQNADLSILEKSVEKMNALKYFTMTTEIDLYDPFADENHHILSQLYCDFTSKDTLIGTKFVDNVKIEGNNKFGKSTKVFNGKSSFTIEYDKKIILTGQENNINTLSNSWGMVNSFLSFKQAIPEMMSNSNHSIIQQKDTIVNKIDSYTFDLIIKDGYIASTGIKYIHKEYRDGSLKKIKLFIDKKSLLPSGYIDY